MRVDATLIEQALGNLLENAAKHTPPGTVVRLRAQQGDEASSWYRSRTTAAGIPEGDARARVREVPPSAGVEGAAGGVGLGLAICRAIVRLHGGRAWAERVPGGGTAFRFTLPLEAPPRVPGETATALIEQRPDHPGRRGRAARSGASCARRSAPKAIAWSSRPPAGAASIDAGTHKPDLAIVDLGLPDMDGVEVIRRIREWSPMPIIVLSARVQERSKIEALDAGADDYVTKPFGVGELLARVRAALRHAVAPAVRQATCALGAAVRRPRTAHGDARRRRGAPDADRVPAARVRSRRHLGMVVTHRAAAARGVGADARARHALPAHLHEAAARQARDRSGAPAALADRDRRRLSAARRRRLVSQASRLASGVYWALLPRWAVPRRGSKMRSSWSGSCGFTR